LGELLVLFEVGRNDDEFWTKFSCSGGGHGGKDSELTGFVTGGGDDSALVASDGDWFSAEFGIGCLFDRGKESIGIEVNDHVEEEGRVESVGEPGMFWGGGYWSE